MRRVQDPIYHIFWEPKGKFYLLGGQGLATPFYTTMYSHPIMGQGKYTIYHIFLENFNKSLLIGVVLIE